jgi:hypothetical protein
MVRAAGKDNSDSTLTLSRHPDTVHHRMDARAWLRIELLIRFMRETPWYAEMWPVIKRALLIALAQRERIQTGPWLN